MDTDIHFLAIIKICGSMNGVASQIHEKEDESDYHQFKKYGCFERHMP